MSKVLILQVAKWKGDPVPRKKRGRRTSKAAKSSSKKVKAKKSKIDSLEIDNEAKAILKALEKLNKPSRCGELAKESEMSVQKVAGKMRSLAKKGYVKRSKDGLYSLSL